MMMAGWYRYYMAYTFRADGAIVPRIGFTTNGSNPYAGKMHTHHAYFRFDFDIGTPSNNAIDSDTMILFYDPITHTFKINHIVTPILFEKKLYRQLFGPSCTIKNKGTGQSCRILNGAKDGTAYNDPYGKGDLWALQYHYNEIDDHVQQAAGSGTEALIDNFVNGESTDGTDIVFWYAVHFTHDPTRTMGEKDFGPTLQIVNWP